MKNLPITWRLNIGLAIFAMLGLVGAGLTWWIGKENAASRNRSSQREINLLRYTDSLSGNVRKRELLITQLLFAPGQTDRRQSGLELLADLDEVDVSDFKLLKERDLASTVERINKELYPALLRSQSALLGSGDREAAHTRYWDSHATAVRLFDDAVADLKSRAGRERKAESKILYWVEMALVAVLILFAAWTVAILRHNLVAFREPVRELRRALDRVGRGDFTIDVRMKRKDEFEDLANGIISMTRGLAAIVGRLHENANVVAISAGNILTASQQQQRAVEELESVSDFLSDSGRKVHFTASQLASSINTVGQASESATRLHQNVEQSLSELREAMGAIKDSSEAINGKLEILNEKAGSVSQVVVTMGKVADQTNLLSINAAIEAEKAGESGKGFAVVANEIQRLADQTAVAAEDIEQMVKEMQTAVAAGVIGTEQFDNVVRIGAEGLERLDTTIGHIHRQIDTIGPQVEIVSSSMHDQTDGARQIQTRSHQLDSVMKHAAESLHTIEAGIDQLESATRNLDDGMARLKLIN